MTKEMRSVSRARLGSEDNENKKPFCENYVLLNTVLFLFLLFDIHNQTISAYKIY